MAYYDINEEPIEIRCPYCRSDGECAHLFARIDRTFGEVEAGFLRLNEGLFFAGIEKGLKNLLTGTGRTSSSSWEPLQQMVTEAIDRYRTGEIEGDDEIYMLIDSGMVYDFLVEYFETEAEVLHFHGDGGPGQTSTYFAVYVSDPASAMKEFISEIEAEFERMERRNPKRASPG